MTRALRWTAVLLVAATPVVPAGAAVRSTEVRGRVVDASGAGIAGIAVRMLHSRKDFQLFDWEFEEAVGSVLLARTDEDGFFEATADPDPEFRYFWLRFYDPKTFDSVRYRLPEDRPITRHLRKGRIVILTIILEDHPDWPQVEGWIERLGPDSPRAELVRQMGIPDRREEAQGVESFWYERNETVYRFRDGKFIGEERWQPSQASATPSVDS